ncbi:MAG TPA: hypothetical protein PKC12_00410 [Thiobacillaceae bacterium]|nr:hypothetical protein [Thiobacillaceae bacterium]
MIRIASKPIRPILLAVLAALFASGTGESRAGDLGRLFYTPAQRAQLEAARTDAGRPVRPTAPNAASVRFDGVMIRSDGRSTSWINGKPRPGGSGTEGLKPGQTRAAGRTYEPYQILPPAPEPAANEVPAP